MRIKILTHLISIFGSMEPDAIHEIPNDDIARSWIRAKIAVPVDADDKVIKLQPDEIPEGTFWCQKHHTLHKIDSGPGKACKKRIAKEAEESAAKEAEEKGKKSED